MNTADLTMSQLIEKYSGIVQRKRMRDIYPSRNVESLCKDIDILLAIIDHPSFESWENIKQRARVGRLSVVERGGNMTKGESNGT